MSCHSHWLFIVTIFLRFLAAASGADDIRVQYFKGVNDDVTVEKGDGTTLLIVCNAGEERSVINIWKTVFVRILSPSKDYEVFYGENETTVAESYRASQGLLNFVPRWQIPSRVDLLVYNKSCIGVHSRERYKLLLHVYYIDFWKVLMLLTGLFVFFAAPYLSGNVVFYYTSGVTLGICASLLIIVFVISRIIPKKVGAISFLVGGWAFVVYVIQMLFYNMKSITARYQGFVAVYLVVVGFISFAVCYRRGHVTDVRTQNLIKWGLQGVALTLIFLSTEWSDIGLSMMLIAVAVHVFPDVWRAKLQVYWKRWFPPEVKLLSEDEYYHQAAFETRKALDKLREHCLSPQCKSWKVMRKLKSPVRFADFIEGNSHLSDEEILNYEVEQSRVLYSEDDDSYSDSEIQSANGANGSATAVH